MAKKDNAARYALVRDGKIINTVLWDGQSPYAPPEGCVMILDNAGKAAKGGTFDGKEMKPRIKPEKQKKEREGDKLKKLVADLQARLDAMEAKQNAAEAK